MSRTRLSFIPKAVPRSPMLDMVERSRSHPSVGRHAHVSGHGKNFVGTVFAFVEATKNSPVPRDRYRDRFDGPDIAHSFYVVMAADGGSHYADLDEVSLL
ncbi:hypothetical protein ACRQ5Q_14900 [Bradyrhizobium sp. PMVTL-01]|uniref:hypothetical protein n=1 Tax=Bradyrhizobium sp. PMVTL-01 TaxID=3434999 RepID=UPI003F6F1788